MQLPRKLLRGDAVIGILLLAIAIWYGLEAQSFRPGRSGDPGAGMFPTLLALFLGLLSLWLMAGAALSPPEPQEQDAQETARARVSARAGLVRALIAAGLSVAFVAVFETLGYVIATALYAGAISLLFRRDNLWVTLLAAIGAVGFMHLLFGVLLNARLPLGLLS